MKKLIPLGLMLTFLLAAPAYAQQEITVVVNGNSVNMENYPVIENNRTLVPFRSVLEAMGAQIDWNANTKTVTCTLGDNVVEVEIGGDNMLANGESIALDVPAKVIDNRTYVPLRAISEGLGAEVVWDAETKTVSVASAAAETAPSKEDTVTDDASGNNAAGEETADGNAAQQGIAYTMTDYSNPITSGDTSIMPVSANYPVFSGNGRAASRLNSYISSDAHSRVDSYKMANTNRVYSLYQSTARNGNPEGFGDYLYELNYDVKNNTDGIISIYVTETIAADNQNKTNIFCINIDSNTGNILTADDICEGAEETAKEGYREMGYGAHEISQATFDDTTFYVEDNKLIYVVYIGTANKSYVEYAIDLPEQTEAVVNTDVAVSTGSTSDEVNSQDDKIIMRLNAEYPVFSGENENLAKLNTVIATEVQEALDDYEEYYKLEAAAAYKAFNDDISNKDERFEPWLWTMDYEVKYNDGSLASVIVSTYTYRNGSDDGTVYEAYMCDLTTGEIVDVDTLIPQPEKTDSDAIAAFKEMIDSDRLNFYTDVYDRFNISNAAKYISEDGVTYMFGPGVLASVSKGTVEVTVPIE